MSNSVYAWHFLAGNKLRDGRNAPADGEWLVHEGEIEICGSGLHASRDPFDALSHAPGGVLCLVECQDVRQEHADKFVCVRRRIVARFDSTEMLRYFARTQALEATKYCEPPDVVADYLHTGDESIRAAARAAAWDAAWYVDKIAARAAARAAAWDAARAAARAAAWDAAWDAARAAAWDAAWAAARDAARAARAAARDAALASSRTQFRDLVYECFECPMQALGINQTHGE